ncbi:MAG: nucleotidyltransferase family protein [Bacteroidales bacterium]|nr:nucleotidyltransferase family protein [Bacteroidales bacterium]
MELNKFLIDHNVPLRDAVKKMDENGMGFIFLTDKNENVVSIITDGDFRRAILEGGSLSDSAKKIGNTNFLFVNDSTSSEYIDDIFQNEKLRVLPLLVNGKLRDLITPAKDKMKISECTEKLKTTPVVIMAGGKGTRMKPFTHILPKPLIPLGEKSILELIMDEYQKYGVKNFYLTVNFKKNLIKAFFEDKTENYSINYVEENKPLGTAGSLRLLKDKLDTPFFVSNCDIIIKGEYDKMLEFHQDGLYDLTLVGSMQHMTVPYGVCTIENGGDLNEIIEKPSYDFLVNTGMYILNPEVLDLIPDDTFFHITHLMEKLKGNGKKVGVYPVSEKSWLDVGQWSEYSKAIDLLQ